MGKKARQAHRKFSSISDAVNLLTLARRIGQDARLPITDNRGMEVSRHAGGMTLRMLEVWETERLILRCDPDFKAALLATDRGTEVPATCFERFPFKSVLVSFPQAFDLHDGQDLCRYHGVIISGLTHHQGPPPDVSAEVWRRNIPNFMHGGKEGGVLYTEYGPVAEGTSVRFGWFFTFPDTGRPGFQTYTLPWRGEFADKTYTVADLVTLLKMVYQESNTLPGEDAETLVPLSVSLLLYLGSAEPDIDRPITIGGDMTTRPGITGTKVSNVGFRIGSAIRVWNRGPSHSARSNPDPDHPTGRTVAPHIRSAHWHRFRVATRDEAGNVIGDRLGVEDVDWHYLLRWIPPVPVNVDEDEGPPVTIRSLEE